jgi:glycosyltransferase involved in cell wall biosynthesis
MATKTLHAQNINEQPEELRGREYVECSIGIMAYNEEANIAHTIEAILEQRGPSIQIEAVIVVASGCTDRTVPIVEEICEREPRVQLYIQKKREGKASAINLFLKQAESPVVVLIGADVIPEEGALENLCAPFKNPKIGMAGGRPIPVNDPDTFMGHAVHLLWRLHDSMARESPKLGEVIAFRNVISGIPTNSAVDEISIQALISQLGYELVYEPGCVVYNKGPLTVNDFLKQRRRIYAGHLKVKSQQNYEASTMKISPIAQQLLTNRDFTLSNPRQICWTAGAVSLEFYARLQGHYDYRRKREHHIWQMVDSTKNLEAGQHKLRRICNTQSVIVFRLVIEGTEKLDIYHEREDRKATEATRKLLPILRASLRKDDRIAINGSGIITTVIRADQDGASVVAKRLQLLAEGTAIRLSGSEVHVFVTYSSLTFTPQASIGAIASNESAQTGTLIAINQEGA